MILSINRGIRRRCCKPSLPQFTEAETSILAKHEAPKHGSFSCQALDDTICQQFRSKHNITCSRSCVLRVLLSYGNLNQLQEPQESFGRKFYGLSRTDQRADQQDILTYSNSRFVWTSTFVQQQITVDIYMVREDSKVTNGFSILAIGNT